MKCDETKPRCNRCTSTRRKCDGYGPITPPESKSPSPSGTLRPSLVLDVSSDALERRTFDFFRSRTVTSVTGYFNDQLWDHMVLQISHSEPAVRHAINALGAQHEESVLRRAVKLNGSTSSVDFRTSFPAVQYSKALVGLHDLLKKDRVPMNVVLICSLAFIHFEALRECFVPALLHAENAIRLLQSSSTFDTGDIDPMLIRAMMRVDVQGAMYLGMRRPGLAFYTSSTDSTLPAAFRDLVHARDLVNTWSCRMYHFMRTEADDLKFRDPGAAPLEVLAKAQELESMFIRLEALLLEFMHRPDVRLTTRESHGLNMLRCRVKVDRILSSCSLYTEACLYDRFVDEFEEIVAICMSISTSDDADTRLFTVSLDEGLLYPLWYSAAHCRDGRIRRSALKILKKLPTGANVWHVEAMTHSAQKCMEFEESGCDKEFPTCQDIPEWKRVHSAGLDGLEVSAAKRDVTMYFRTRPNGPDGEWTEHQDTVHWWVAFKRCLWHMLT